MPGFSGFDASAGVPRPKKPRRAKNFFFEKFRSKYDRESYGKYYFRHEPSGAWGYADSKSEAKVRVREELQARERFHASRTVRVKSHVRKGRTVKGYARAKKWG